MAKKPSKASKQAATDGNLEQALSRSEQFFNNYKKTILGVVVGIIVVVAGGMIYSSKVVAPRELRAAEALFPGENYFLNGEFETALKGDAYDYAGFESIASEFSGTKSGKLAAAYAGICCAQLDSFEVAARYLAKFKGKDSMVSPAVLGALANCYASMDQLPKAAATFEKAAKNADNSLLTPYYLQQAALVYEALDQPQKALKLYNTIKLKYPDSTEGVEVEKYITRVTSK